MKAFGSTFCRGKRGVSLPDVLLAVLLLGLLLAPLCAYFVRLADLGALVAEKRRTEAWHSLQGAVVSSGSDLALAALSERVRSPSLDKLALGTVSRGDVLFTDTGARVRPLVLGIPGDPARVRALGFELVPGAAPAAPLVPPPLSAQVNLVAPTATPLPGSVLPLSSFVLQDGSLKHLIQVQAALPGDLVVFQSGSQKESAQGQLSVSLSLEALSGSLPGVAWSEHAGVTSPSSHFFLGRDGKRLWIDGGVSYNPSPSISLSYLLGLGAPELHLGDEVFPSGAYVDFDYSRVLALRGLGSASLVAWPDKTLASLSSVRTPLAHGFTLRFEGSTVSGGGDISSLFSELSLSSWRSESTLQAKPVLSSHCVSDTGVWYFRRQVTKLPAPVLGRVDELEPLMPGSVLFVAGTVKGVGPIGRLSARGESMVSSGPELTLEVLP